MHLFPAPPVPRHSVAQSAPATFSIQLVKATETHEGNVYTFAPAEGCVMSSVFANGAAVADAELVKNEDGTWTWTPTAETGDFDVVAAATTTRTAPEHKWYESAKVVNSVALTSSLASEYGPFGWGLDTTDDYIAGSWSSYGAGFYLFDANKAESTTEYPVVYAVKEGTTRGTAICKALNVVLRGSSSGTTMVAYPINAEPVVSGEGKNTFDVITDNGVAFDHAQFTEDGQYLFCNCYQEDGAKIDGVSKTQFVYKYQVINGLRGNGEYNLKCVDYWPIGYKVRYMNYAKVGDDDVIYAMGDDTDLVIINTTKDTSKSIETTPNGEKFERYDGVQVVGDTIYFYDMSAMKMYVNEINATTLWLDDSIKEIDLNGIKPAGNADYAGFYVTSDERSMIIGGGFGSAEKINVVQYVPQYTVSFVDDKATPPEAQKVFEGELATDPQYAPTVEGFEFKGWFAPEADTAFDFTTPITADLTLTAKWEEVQTWPEDWDTPEFEALTDEEKKAYGDKFKTWKGSFAGEITAAMLDNFLMNVAPDATTPTLKIDSIAVEGDTATIVVSAGTADLEKVNGVLYVDGANDLTNWTTTEVDLGKDATFVEGKATFVVDGAKFMKAGVGFKAPVVEE